MRRPIGVWLLMLGTIMLATAGCPRVAWLANEPLNGAERATYDTIRVYLNQLEALDAAFFNTQFNSAGGYRDGRQQLDARIRRMLARVDSTRREREFSNGDMAAYVRASLPWPPPQPSVAFEIPSHLVSTVPGATLRVIHDSVTRALGRAGFDDRSYYDMGGGDFAIGLPMQTIDDDGRPKAGPARWSSLFRTVAGDFQGLDGYLRQLFKAPPGKYRFIVIALTKRELTPLHGNITAADPVRLRSEGAVTPPRHLDAQADPDMRVVALIYEFQRRVGTDEAELLPTSTLTAVGHLSAAGLWSEAQLLSPRRGIE